MDWPPVDWRVKLLFVLFVLTSLSDGIEGPYALAGSLVGAFIMSYIIIVGGDKLLELLGRAAHRVYKSV